MSTASPIDHKTYYARVTAVSIGDVARELLAGRITVDSSTRILADCPRHQSKGKTSFTIDEHSGMFYCFGCGVGGDVIGLVEFIRYGFVTKSTGGRMSDTHREARDFVAAKAGLPPLSSLARGEDADAAERSRTASEAVFSALTELARIQSKRLLETPAALAWCLEKWGLREASIKQHCIGIGDPHDHPDLLKLGFDARVLASTGAFKFTADDRANPFFNRRITFPYFARGRVVYMIGRYADGFTPALDFEKRAKYRKLPVRDDTLHAFVSPDISNDVLWGEDVLFSKPKRVVLTEGVTDAIMAQDAGFPTISPVTVRLKGEDAERLVRKLRGYGVEEIIIIQDNEVSGVGFGGALDTARLLDREKIKCRLGLIPLRDAQHKARAELRASLGDEAWAAIERARPADRGGLIRAKMGEEDAQRLEKLIDDAKIDVCEWFKSGGTPEEFRAILDAARDPVEVAIETVPIVDDQVEQARLLEDVLSAIGDESKPAQEKHLAALKERTRMSAATLKSEVSRLKREERSGKRPGPKTRGAQIPTAEPGSCRALVEGMLIDARNSREAPDYGAIGAAVWDWLAANGAIFFRSTNGMPSMFFADEVWRMSGGGGAREVYVGLIDKLTGVVPTSTGGRTMYAKLAAMTANRGEVRDEFGWIASNVSKRRIHLTLSNARHELVCISPEGVDVVKNGDNPERVILRASSKLQPIEYDESIADEDLDDVLRDTIGRNMACREDAKQAILDWFCCYLLLEFTGTRPILRLEGHAGSGKTWASKMLTTLLFGQETQKNATDAANRADAATSPIVALDNIEGKDASQELVRFLLTAANGSQWEKRTSASEHEITIEKPLCLILSTGIEPLGGDLPEMMSRTFGVLFDRAMQGDPILEAEILATIRERRSSIMSAIFRRASKILAMMRDGAHGRAMLAVYKAIGAKHPKWRCVEYLALMYLQRIAAARECDRAAMFEKATPEFSSGVLALCETTAETSRDASPVVASILGIFNAAGSGGAMGRLLGTSGDAGTGWSEIRDVTATGLFLALLEANKNFGVPTGGFKNAAQFSRRLVAAAPQLSEHGIVLRWHHDETRNMKVYSLSVRPDARLTPIGKLFGNPGDVVEENGQVHPERERAAMLEASAAAPANVDPMKALGF